MMLVGGLYSSAFDGGWIDEDGFIGGIALGSNDGLLVGYFLVVLLRAEEAISKI